MAGFIIYNIPQKEYSCQGIYNKACVYAYGCIQGPLRYSGTIMTSSVSLHEQLSTAPIAQIVEDLRELMPDGTIANTAGIIDERGVLKWATGERSPSKDAEFRLRIAKVLVDTVVNPEYPPQHHAWLICCDPRIDERIPQQVVSHAEASIGVTPELEQVYQSAVAFAAQE
jgi:hypothetical protein